MPKHKGRQGPNATRIPRQLLLNHVLDVFSVHGVIFPVKKNGASFHKLVWDLYKDLLLVAPALAITFDTPVTMYGVGSVAVRVGADGKRRLRARFSSTARNVASKYEISPYFYVSKEFWRVHGMLSNAGAKKDKSLTEVL